MSVEYMAWWHMKSRCTDPKHPSFSDYGARGIAVCAEWLNDWRAFVAHVGPRPSKKHSLDRIDNARGYEPGNVRWATATEQSRNRRSNLELTVRGEKLCVAAWAERVGISRHVIYDRLRRGWDAERAIFTPALSYVECGKAAARKRWGAAA